MQKHISIGTASDVAKVIWPDFIEINGCVFAAFQCRGGEPQELSTGKTETECFINHTHLFDEFRSRATVENRIQHSNSLDVVQQMYDETHPDFIAACDLGLRMARMWACKLKFDFPKDRFRVYYTQYDNPIVRFHRVRKGEPDWLSDDVLLAASSPSFRNAVIYDTEYLERPAIKRTP
jgi:hypothetical protein